MRGFWSSLLFFSGYSLSAHAGAWTLPQGETQAIVTTEYSYAPAKFDGDGRAIAIEPYEKIELRFFGEYGLTDWATLMVQPEWRWKSFGGDSDNGPGRLGLGVRTRLWRDEKSVISVQGNVAIPMRSDRRDPLNSGESDWQAEARLLYGRGFEFRDRRGFFGAEAGYRHRFGSPENELHLDVTAGLDLKPDVLGLVQSFNTVSVDGEFQEHKLSVSTVYRLSDRWSLQAGAITTAYGKNAFRDQGGFVALWAKF